MDWAGIIDAWALRFFHEMDYGWEARAMNTFATQMAPLKVRTQKGENIRAPLPLAQKEPTWKNTHVHMHTSTHAHIHARAHTHTHTHTSRLLPRCKMSTGIQQVQQESQVATPKVQEGQVATPKV